MSGRKYKSGADTEYYHNVLKRVIAVIKYLAIRGLASRGTVRFARQCKSFIGGAEINIEWERKNGEEEVNKMAKVNNMVERENMAE
ncbi:hypothetical protein TNCV_1552421 [Trichonephila clavipes]|nr:hypothetical protein TNCV_1552421 [Trichonephila clavipes]